MTRFTTLYKREVNLQKADTATSAQIQKLEEKLDMLKSTRTEVRRSLRKNRSEFRAALAALGITP